MTVEEASLAAAGENLSTNNKRHSDNSIIHDSIAATLLTALALIVYLLTSKPNKCTTIGEGEMIIYELTRVEVASLRQCFDTKNCFLLITNN